MLALASSVAAVLYPTNPPSVELPFLGCLSLYASSGLLALSKNPLNLQSGSLAFIMLRCQAPLTQENVLYYPCYTSCVTGDLRCCQVTPLVPLDHSLLLTHKYF